MKAIFVGSVFAVALLVSCGGGPPQTKEAVREAVIKHIAKRNDMTLSSLNVEVSSVSFQQGKAEATVSFSTKGTPGGGGMTMPYQLEANGREWVVKSRSDKSGGTNPHGATGMDGTGGSMPMPAMPEGHPPVEKKQ